MTSTELPRSQKENITQILKAGWHLLELVNQVLDLSAVESGKVPLSIGTSSIRDALADCRALLEP